MLTGAIFSLTLFLTPVPMLSGPSGLAELTPGTYRMAGQIVRNSCGGSFAPWPDEWEVTRDALWIGKRKFKARPMRSAVVFEIERNEPASCIAAGWTVKLAARGAGIVGDAVWEIRPSAATHCEIQPAPCSVIATVEGLPLAHQPAVD
jgi:hypothetical protein